MSDDYDQYVPDLYGRLDAAEGRLDALEWNVNTAGDNQDLWGRVHFLEDQVGNLMEELENLRRT